MISDAFLHQIHTSTDRLSSLVNLVNDVMQNRVDHNIQNIRDMFLFDYDLAFGQVWVKKMLLTLTDETCCFLFVVNKKHVFRVKVSKHK